MYQRIQNISKFHMCVCVYKDQREYTTTKFKNSPETQQHM